jgi:hypothetical protein
MICKNCSEPITEIVPHPMGFSYIHWRTQSPLCNLMAEPVLKINRHLDAKQILADLESRQPRPKQKSKVIQPDYVEGVFEGEL